MNEQNIQSAPSGAYPPLHYDIRIRTDNIKIGDGTGLLAFADVVVGGELKIKGFTVRSGKHGLFVGCPGRSDKEGKWYDQSYPISKSGRERLHKAILDAYAQHLSNHRSAYIVDSPDEMVF